jgi:hypothetical protein
VYKGVEHSAVPRPSVAVAYKVCPACNGKVVLCTLCLCLCECMRAYSMQTEVEAVVQSILSRTYTEYIQSEH